MAQKAPYDLIVIGSGPGGEKAAIQGAKLKKRVLVIERKPQAGGNSMHMGTIPSKTLRESVKFLSQIHARQIFGISVHQDEHLTVDALMHRKRGAINSLVERLDSNFERNDVDYVRGQASFLDPHTVQVTHVDGSAVEQFTGQYIVIATGSRPYRPDFVDFNHPRVLDSDTVLNIHDIPKTLTIIGAGVIGCEYATIFSHMGVKVNLVNPRQVLLDFLDLEISNALGYLMRERGVRIRLGETLNAVSFEGDEVLSHLESGKVLKSDYLLYANGRSGNTDALALDKLGIVVNSRKQIDVNPFFQTLHPNIYAIGDVIGFPSLAATAMDQGRLATKHALTGAEENFQYGLMPTGIYTIPEISFCGETEENLTKQKVPYEVGTATYREIARGQINGNTTGRLKLLFHRDTLKILGVHIIGDEATDLIHTGAAVMAFGGTIEYFIDTVFNYPTYSEAFRVAALNGYNRL